MVKIFICEDDDKTLEFITEVVKKYIFIEELDMEVALSTANPHEILSYVQENEISNSFYFLDVDLKMDIDGIVLADRIRKYDVNGLFVFVTSHPEFRLATFDYGIGALGYIIKDCFEQMKQAIILNIDRAKERLFAKDKKDSAFIVKGEDGWIIEKYNRIMFFETSAKVSVSKHKVMLTAINRRMEFHGNLSEITEMDSRFFRCDKSCVVNIDNIVHVNSKSREIIMKDGSICKGSVRGVKALMKAMKS